MSTSIGHRLIPWLALALSLLPLGCAEDTTTGPGGVEPCAVAVAGLCQPCEGSSECQEEGAICIQLPEGGACGRTCDATGDCPTGYECVSLLGESSLQCVPVTGSCSCTAENLGLVRPCALATQPLDPESPSTTCPGLEVCGDGGWGSCEVPVEVCDVLDNDCDGEVDEDFRDASGLYVTVEHCGGCGLSCLALSADHATPVCELSGGAAACAFACEAGWVDIDGVADNGCECQPESDADVPDEAGLDSDCDGIDGEIDRGVFVSKAGADDGLGTLASPLRSIQAGIDAAAVAGLRDVYVSTGVYEESFELADGVNVYGGYSGDFGVRDRLLYQTAVLGQTATESLPGAVNGFAVGYDAQGTTLDGFSVFGADAMVDGGSTYAVWLRGCGSALQVTHNDIVAGRGAIGATGQAGDNGPAAVDGGDGVTAEDIGGQSCTLVWHDAGGVGGATTCGGDWTSGGGGGTRWCPDAPADVQNGAQTSDPAESGEDGDNDGGAGGEAGWDGLVGYSSCGICSSSKSHAGDGEAGAAGQDGATGAAAIACPAARGDVSDTGLWYAFDGGDGGGGSPGGGGGGGGAGGGVDVTSACSPNLVVGGSGGGGGGGGCQGLGGTGGGGGGGSFGVFLSWDGAPESVPIVRSNGIFRGWGGHGGAGGIGGAGGGGGSGGAGGDSGQGQGDFPINFCGSSGGAGGDGGRGGDGAGGAGGCGGVSYGIYVDPPTGDETAFADNAFPDSGGAGVGGFGGPSFGHVGAPGPTGVYDLTNL